MITITEGMTPAQFLAALNNNRLSIGDAITDDMQGADLKTNIEANYDSIRKYLPELATKSTINVGMSGSAFISALNANINKVEAEYPSDALISYGSTYLDAPVSVNAVWQNIVEDKDSYTLRISLKVVPSANVVVTISAENDFLDFSGTELTFTPANYSTYQSITIGGKVTAAWRDIGGVHDENIVLTMASSDATYNNVVKTYPVRVGATELDYVSADPYYRFNATEISVLAVPLREQYHFTDENDLPASRAGIIQDIWLGAGLPTKSVPDAIELNFENDTYFAPVSDNLSSVTKLTWMIGQGFGNYHYHCIPIVPNGKVVFSPFGHGQAWANISTDYGVDALITQLLDEGYYAICSYMVGFGSNKIIKEDTSGNHSLMATYEEEGVYNPMELFINDWIYEMNYCKANLSFTEYSMMGHSAGGRTTFLVSALLEDIHHAFSIAGGMFPTFMYTAPSAHYENGTSTNLVNLFFFNHSVLDFYVLTAWKRHCHHIINPIEYGATYASGEQVWSDNVKAKIESLNPSSVYTLDSYSYPAHYVNQDCIDIIFSYL